MFEAEQKFYIEEQLLARHTTNKRVLSVYKVTFNVIGGTAARSADLTSVIEIPTV